MGDEVVDERGHARGQQRQGDGGRVKGGAKLGVGGGGPAGAAGGGDLHAVELVGAAVIQRPADGGAGAADADANAVGVPRGEVQAGAVGRGGDGHERGVAGLHHGAVAAAGQVVKQGHAEHAGMLDEYAGDVGA